MIDEDVIEVNPSVYDLVLCDERGLYTAPVEQRAEDEDPAPQQATKLFVASTDAEDRALDVVRQDWRLARYRANPVFLDNHNPLRVAGHALSAGVPKTGDDAGKLLIRVQFDLDSPDPAIRTVGHQHMNGIRRAGSVGFRPGRRTARDKLPADHQYYREPIEIEGFWGKYKHAGTLMEQNELLEFSSATIPMNPDALQRSFLERMGELEPEDVDRRLQVVTQTVPRAVGSDLVSSWRAATTEQRAGFIELLWVDLLERLRTELRTWVPQFMRGTDGRRIILAHQDAGPARVASNDFFRQLAAMI